MRLALPYARSSILDTLRREAAVLEVEYTEDGVECEAVVKPELWASCETTYRRNEPEIEKSPRGKSLGASAY